MTNETIDPVGIDQSPDPAAQRRAQLAALIPEAFSEGQLDISALKRALGGEALIEGGERYALTWAGKANAYKVLQTPSRATLRPQRDLSVNFDEAQHVFIEGENLEVLKVLQKAYFGKVKLIYIDPPYNTGSDSFIYPDRFQESKEDYLRRINDLSDDGTLMREGFFRKNSKESGHYHSNWLSMMLPRLYIARNLLREDGVIFISCDDNEVHNLRCLMNEVFGEENFIASVIWQKKTGGGAKSKGFIPLHEYILCFAKQVSDTFDVNGTLSDKTRAMYNKRDEHSELLGPYATWPLDTTSMDERENLRFAIFHDGHEIWPRKQWLWSKARVEKAQFENKLIFNFDAAAKRWSVRFKGYLFGDDGEEKSGKPTTLFVGPYTQEGTADLEKHFDRDVFPFPKPVALIRKLLDLKFSTSSDLEEEIIFDFFGGSATVAEAVIEQSAFDHRIRKLIMVQLPEPTEPESAAQLKGLSSIADIGRARFSGAIKNLVLNADLASKPLTNLGFKSFLLSPSNFKQWRGDGIDTPEQLAEQMLMFAKSEKEGAAVEHMLYELLLKFGQELVTPVETLDVGGGKVYAINGRKMLFVLESFTDAMIQPLVDMRPREIIAIDGVFLDSDPLKSNLDLQCRDAGIKFTCL